MKTLCLKFLYWLVSLNMWGLAIVGPILFAAGVLSWTGNLSDGASLNMLGRPVESNSDHQAFLVSVAAFSLLGWAYAILAVSGRIRFGSSQVGTNT